jgi:hypothetical protein
MSYSAGSGELTTSVDPTFVGLGGSYGHRCADVGGCTMREQSAALAAAVWDPPISGVSFLIGEAALRGYAPQLAPPCDSGMRFGIASRRA